MAEITTTKSGQQYKPFPYFGSQVILASQRIHLHARQDSVLIFARKSIGLSSIGTLNFDSEQKCTINSPRIDLGLNANEQLVLGTSFVKQLKDFLTSIAVGATIVKSSGESDIATTVSKLVINGEQTASAAKKLSDALDGLLSTTSYTL